MGRGHVLSIGSSSDDGLNSSCILDIHCGSQHYTSRALSRFALLGGKVRACVVD